MSFQLKKHKSAISYLYDGSQNRLSSDDISKIPQLTSRKYGKKIRNQLDECKFAINRVLRIKRQEYHHSVRNSIYKLNTTISWAKDSQRHLEDIQRYQIKLNTKNNPKNRQNNDKESVKVNKQINYPQIIYQKNQKDQGFTSQKNLFCLKEESVICYEDVFPLYRLGASLVCYNKMVYIYGGYSFKGLSNTQMLHYYDLKNQLWKKVANHEGQLPFLCTCYHTAEQYKQYLVFTGGISIDSIKNRRYFNCQISFFNLEQETWSNIRWNFSLRSHASTMYGNMLFLYGGINEKDEYLNQIFFISLNQNAIQQSTIMQYTTSIKKAGIAFHKIVNTYNIQQNLREKILLDGIISYGGKFFDGSVCSDASIFRINFKGKELFNCSKTQPEDCNGWQILSFKGTKPVGRYDHTMNIINKKGICLIVGGMNESDQILNDVWIMDLCSLCWIQAEFDTHYSILSIGISGHTSTCDEQSIYIFGGIRNTNTEIATKFFSISLAPSKINHTRRVIPLLSSKSDNFQ